MNKIIKKSHQLTVFRGNLSSQEQNILALLIMSLKKSATNYIEDFKRLKAKEGVILHDAYQPPPEELPDYFEFQLSELAKLMGQTPSSISQNIKITVSTMMARIIEWPSPNGDWELEPLLGPSRYIKNKGILQIHLHKRTKSAILDETRGVGFVDLDLFMAVKGAREKRILDLICKFRNDRDFSMKFDEFEKVMGVTVSDFERGLKDFRYSVLDRPLKRIFNASNGVWEPTDDKNKGYELIKVGRAVKKIIFKVNYNDKNININNNKQIEEKSINEFASMEDVILTIDSLDIFNRFLVEGYSREAEKLGYKIPARIAKKIKSLS